MGARPREGPPDAPAGRDQHLITANLALPLLLESDAGLHVEITDGTGDHYRFSLFYDLAKADTRRLAFSLNRELAPRGHAAVAITPGFLRSEAMLAKFGVTEATWREFIEQDPHFAWSESPAFVGRGLAALAADPERGRFGGQVLSSGTLGALYEVDDADGSRPDFPGRAIEAVVADLQAAHSLDDLAAVSGPMALPFVQLVGNELRAELDAGTPIRKAVERALRL